MKKWLIISDYDANNSFVVEGDTLTDAMLCGLNELGWNISANPFDDEEEEEP